MKRLTVLLLSRRMMGRTLLILIVGLYLGMLVWNVLLDMVLMRLLITFAWRVPRVTLVRVVFSRVLMVVCRR